MPTRQWPARSHGATLEMAVADMPYGDRQGGVRDPWGNLWWISQRLVEAPYTYSLARAERSGGQRSSGQACVGCQTGVRTLC